MIRDLPLEERPRERLTERGASALSSVELIAIVLGSGTREKSALNLASELLEKFGSLENLAESTIQELLTVKGVGPAKAVLLHATFALWKRISPNERRRSLIDSPKSAFEEIYPDLIDEKTEVLFLLLRDARRGVLHKEIISRGTLNQLLVHPREIYCCAIRHRAHSLIIAHNHPTGDCSPSTSDYEITKNLKQAGAVIGIPLSDHLVIGNGTYYSFWERGALDGSTAMY